MVVVPVGTVVDGGPIVVGGVGGGVGAVVVVGGTVVVTGSGTANVGAGTWYGPPGGVPCTDPALPGSTGGSVVGGVGRNATAGRGGTMGAGWVKAVAGTPARAWLMKLRQVAAGHVPP